MRGLWKPALLAAASFIGVVPQALAQEDFTRDRNVGVADRARPDYDALGVPVGDFLLFPRLDLIEGYDDNVLAEQNPSEHGFFTQIQPSFALNSQWSQDALNLTGHGSINRYDDLPKEASDDYGAKIDGRLDVLESTNVTGSVSYDINTVPRESEFIINDTVKPVQYALWTDQITATHTFNRLRVSLTGSEDQYNYRDGYDSFGNTVDEHVLNLQDWAETARADYALSPDTAVFLSGNLNQHYYLQQPPATPLDRNGNGYELLGGVDFQISELITSEISGGYLAENYNHLVGQNYSNFAMHGLVKWFPTELTTVTLKADRLVQASSDLQSAGYISTGVGLTVDHELRTDVILNASLSYADDSYQGIDRDDHRWTAGFGATYLVNRDVGVALNYTHNSQESLGTARYINFDVNKVMLSLVLQR